MMMVTMRMVMMMMTTTTTMMMMMSTWCFCCCVQTPKPDDANIDGGEPSADAPVTAEVAVDEVVSSVEAAEHVAAVVEVKLFLHWLVHCLLENYFCRFDIKDG